jgi:hypothetical protein
MGGELKEMYIFEKTSISHKGMDRRSTSYIIPNRRYRRNIADMNELSDIVILYSPLLVSTIECRSKCLYEHESNYLVEEYD